MKHILAFIFLFFFTCPAMSASNVLSQVQVSAFWNNNSEQSVQIKIPPVNNLKLALFKRNGYTYFVFQSPQELQIDETTLQKFPLIRLKHPTALILRGVFPEKTQPQISVQKRFLYIRMEDKSNLEKTTFKTKWILNGALLELNDADLIEFKDPSTSETFFAFLTPHSHLFMKEKYDTPEMIFLPTYQGIVIYPKTSSFHVQKGQTGYIIHPQNRKSLTPSPTDTNSFEKIDWKAYAEMSPEKINDEIQVLKAFILYISDEGKDRLHQEMAQLYLSQALSEPALEILQNMPESNVRTKLTFLAYVLADEPVQALIEWNKIQNPSFNLKLWKNTIDNEPLLKEYNFEKINLTPNMAFVFWKNVLQKANRENNQFLLIQGIDKLKELPLNDYQKQVLIYFEGQLAEKENNLKKAIKIYNSAENLPLSQYSGRILFSKINVQTLLQEISVDEAIYQFEKMRHFVADTDLEIPLLQILATLYNEKKDVAQALLTERQMLSITQDDAILKRMQRRFEHFFVIDQDPVKRAAIYTEFKELMPTGRKAVQIKQQLLSDFIELDLLDRAYDLAMELAQTTFEQTQQQSALYAYLIAALLENTEKMSDAAEFLPSDWKEKPLPANMPEILKWSYKKMK